MYRFIRSSVNPRHTGFRHDRDIARRNAQLWHSARTKATRNGTWCFLGRHRVDVYRQSHFAGTKFAVDPVYLTGHLLISKNPHSLCHRLFHARCVSDDHESIRHLPHARYRFGRFSTSVCRFSFSTVVARIYSERNARGEFATHALSL